MFYHALIYSVNSIPEWYSSPKIINCAKSISMSSLPDSRLMIIINSANAVSQRSGVTKPSSFAVSRAAQPIILCQCQTASVWALMRYDCELCSNSVNKNNITYYSSTWIPKTVYLKSSNFLESNVSFLLASRLLKFHKTKLQCGFFHIKTKLLKIENIIGNMFYVRFLITKSHKEILQYDPDVFLVEKYIH